MVAFPVSLMWYRKDIDQHGIKPGLYWTVIVLYVVACLVGTAFAAERIMAEVSKQLDEVMQ